MRDGTFEVDEGKRRQVDEGTLSVTARLIVRVLEASASPPSSPLLQQTTAVSRASSIAGGCLLPLFLVGFVITAHCCC